MKSVCLLIVSLISVSCGESLSDMLDMGKNPYAKHKSDPVFATYVDSFKNEFNVRVSVPIILKEIEASKAGVCYVWSDGYREVQINSKYWYSFSEDQKEQIVFHELGHCVFNLNHDDSTLAVNEQCPNSIMRSYAFSEWEINHCYVPERTHYMENLHARL
jgi:hypothetical protein